MTRVCIPIVGPSEAEARAQLQEALALADLIEVRWDLLKGVDPDFLSGCTLPMIFTLRGEVPERLLALKPDYIDLPEPFSAPPGIKLIRSHHDWEGTPQDLAVAFQQLRAHPADIYKLATTAYSALDALRMTAAVAQQPGDVIGLTMGVEGQISRFSPRLPWTYAALPAASSAPGQLHPEAMRKKELFALIGDPVKYSPGPAFHNEIFAREGRSAHYLALCIPREDLEAAVPLLKQLPLRGFSVTMPLKEAIIPHLDALAPSAQRAGVVNTICIENGQWIGHNTDGRGAIDALEERLKVEGKRVAILGRGGAAKAIAAEVRLRGGEPTCYGRQPELAPYDVLIQCTPVGMLPHPEQMPITAEQILPEKVVMEVIHRPEETTLAKTAAERGCCVVGGGEMFRRQALLQQELWK